MEVYILRKMISFENGDVIEVNVNDTSEIREVTKSDAVAKKGMDTAGAMGVTESLIYKTKKKLTTFT